MRGCCVVQAVNIHAANTSNPFKYAENRSANSGLHRGFLYEYRFGIERFSLTQPLTCETGLDGKNLFPDRGYTGKRQVGKPSRRLGAACWGIWSLVWGKQP